MYPVTLVGTVPRDPKGADRLESFLDKIIRNRKTTITLDQTPSNYHYALDTRSHFEDVADACYESNVDAHFTEYILSGTPYVPKALAMYSFSTNMMAEKGIISVQCIGESKQPLLDSVLGISDFAVSYVCSRGYKAVATFLPQILNNESVKWMVKLTARQNKVDKEYQLIQDETECEYHEKNARLASQICELAKEQPVIHVTTVKKVADRPGSLFRMLQDLSPRRRLIYEPNISPVRLLE